MAGRAPFVMAREGGMERMWNGMEGGGTRCPCRAREGATDGRASRGPKEWRRAGKRRARVLKAAHPLSAEGGGGMGHAAGRGRTGHGSGGVLDGDGSVSGQRDHGVAGRRDHGVVGQRDHGVLGRRGHGVLGQRDHGVLGRRDHGVVGPWDHGVVGRRDGRASRAAGWAGRSNPHCAQGGADTLPMGGRERKCGGCREGRSECSAAAHPQRGGVGGHGDSHRRSANPQIPSDLH